MNKKGVEMSINTVIVIVIVLLILLVMAFMLTNGFQNWGTSTSCASKGNPPYHCATSCTDGEMPTSWSCPNKGETCCGPSVFASNT